MLFACASDLEDNIAQEGCEIVVSARCVDAKSTLSSDLGVVWSADDRVTVLSLNGSASSVSEPGGAESVSCDFRVKNWPVSAVPRYAVFNGSSDRPGASVEGRYIRTSIKTNQKISDENSFGRDANLSIGELESSDEGGWQTQMKNVCALIGFSLDRFDDVKAISVYNGSGGKSISGTFDIFIEDGIPVIKEDVDGKSYVAALMEDDASVFKKGTTYYLCVRPGVEINPDFLFLLSDGTRYRYRYPETLYLRRSTLYDCGVVDSEAVEVDVYSSASNEGFAEGGRAEFEVWEDKLVEGYHPRLVFDKDDFEQLKGMVGGNDAVGKLHDHLMTVAKESVADTKRLAFQLDASGKRILDVSRTALARMISCAYAYRMTGLNEYVDKVAQDLADVCSFSSWNPDHYLDVAEMSAAVAIAYDWLYDTLSESLKATIVQKLRDYALQTSRDGDYTWWYNRIGNWNQVCNGGLVCAAAAIYEYCPQLAQAVIDDAVRTNRTAVEGIYYPDGAYPEGPTYWGYGTLYQVLMLSVLEDVFGTDYGISSAQGFMDTALFKIFARGSMNMQFNFADNGVSNNSNYSMYYFAYKKNDPSILYAEVEDLLDDPDYTGSEHKGLMILSLKYAMKMNLEGLSGPTQKFYVAQGNTPVMMCRSGWNSADHYLGIKGGQDGYLHGHMDGGTFVFYADNVRWAMDINRQNYADVEVGIQKLGGSLADYSQNSLRWRLFRLNCRQHNTLTVNDKDHDVTAFVKMIATENSSSRMSATFDLTPLFGGDLVKAERTAALCNDDYLEVKDVLKAPAGKSAHVRWTMVTMAKPELTSGGISLKRNFQSRMLKVSGGNVTYKIWSSDLEDYEDILRVNGQPIEAPINTQENIANGKVIYLCGYETDIPAGQELTLLTTLK